MDAIVFDLDGTLIGYDRPYETILSAAFRSTAGEAREEWTDAYSRAFFAALSDQRPDPYERAAAGVADRFDLALDPERLAETLRAGELAAVEPTPGAAEDLRRLGADHRIGVVTNGVTGFQRRKLDRSDLAEHVDATVVSYEAGANKPEPEPYDLLTERLPADRYAMVGDSEDDVLGARRVGWAARRYDGGGFGDLPGAIDW